MKTRITKLLFILFIIVLPFGFINAQTSYIPRVYLGGYGGTDSNLIADTDILAPIYQTANSNFFAYGQGKVGYENESWEDNTYTGSLGLGYRQIVKDTTVLGAYAFGDYTNSTSGHNFWVVSPGIESLSCAWDFRINGYFPVGKTRWVDEGWADEFGDYRYVKFTGHQLRDHWYQYYQETGIGGDAEVGRNLYMLKGMFKGILFKGFLNGYYYDMKRNDDVVGGGVRLTIQPNRSVKISLKDSYDNYEHNTFMVGVQLSFYDLISDHTNDPVDVQDLQRNLFVPIERNLATIGSGSSIPVTRSDNPEDTGVSYLEDGNIWFFKPSTQSQSTQSQKNDQQENNQQDGTYEHPFNGINETYVNYVETHYKDFGTTTYPYPKLYFTPGRYNLDGFTNNRLSLPYGWDMHGRTSTYTRPATGADRATFIGGMDLLAGNNTLDSIALNNNTGNQQYGVIIGTPPLANNDSSIGGIYFNNVSVGTLNSTTGYSTAMRISNASGVTLNQSQIYGYGDVSGMTTGSYYGIYMLNNSTLNLMNNNTILVKISSPSLTGTGVIQDFAIGTKGSTTNILGNDNNIAAEADVGALNDDIETYSIGADTSSHVIISGNNNIITSEVQANTMNSGGGISMNSIWLDDNSNVTISGNNNHVTATAVVGNEYSGSFGEWMYGIGAYNGSSINISGNNNQVKAAANIATSNDDAPSSWVSGMYALQDSTITISGNNNSFTGYMNIGTVSGNNDLLFSSGIRGRFSSNINVSGHGNTINGTATYGTQSGTNNDFMAFGFYVDDNSIIDFSNSAIDTAVTVNGATEQYGIWASSTSHLERNDTDITNFSQYTELMHFEKIGAGIAGDSGKIYWWNPGLGKLPW